MARIRNNPAPVIKQEGLLESGADIKKKRQKPPDVDLSSDEVKEHKVPRKRKKNKNPSLDATSADGSSTSETVETPVTDNKVLSIEKESSARPGSDTNEADTLPEINADSGKGHSLQAGKKARNKRKNNPCTNSMAHSSLDATTANRSSMPETVEIPVTDNKVSSVDKESSARPGSDNNEADILLEINADSGKDSSLQLGRKTRHKRKKNSSTNSAACPSLDATSADSSSVPETVEMGLEKKMLDETLVADNNASSVEKESSAPLESDNNETEINADSGKDISLQAGRKVGRKRKKIRCTDSTTHPSLDDTSADSSSMPEAVETGLGKKMHEETLVTGDNKVSSVEKESSAPRGSDTNEIDMLLEINADSGKDSSSQTGRKARRKTKKNPCTDSTVRPSLDATSANNSSTVESVETGPEKKIHDETPVTGDNKVSLVEKESSARPGSDNNETDIVPETNADSGKDRSLHEGRKPRHTRKKSPCTRSTTHPSLDSTSAENSSMLESVENGLEKKMHDETPVSDNKVSSVETESSAPPGSDNSETDILPETNADSGKDSSLHVGQIKRRKRKKNPCTNSTACSSLDATSADNSSIAESVEMGLEKKMHDETPPITDNLVPSVEKENNDLPGSDNNETDILPEINVDSGKDSSLHVARKARRKRKKDPSTDKDSNGSLCPSPIRGVVHDFALADVSNKQSSQLDSFKADEVTFSFRMAGKVCQDESSASHSEMCQSGGRVASGNGPPTVHNETAVADMPTFTQSETIDGQRAKEVSSSSSLSSDVSSSENKELEAEPVLLDQRLLPSTRKKLLVLDLNGILADVINDYRMLRNVKKAHKKVGGKSVFKRPFCDGFLKFCFERFDVGVWSSRKKYNVEDVVDYLMGEAKHKLLFSWDQSRCTITGFNTIENVHKPLVLKELKKLWDKEEADLPWEKGDYSPSNTLLVDDSPYKALRNPPHTAIFPPPYHFKDENDNFLGPKGELRLYLEQLAVTDNVQQYVREHPFGQKAISDSNPSWDFYLKIIAPDST